MAGFPHRGRNIRVSDFTEGDLFLFSGGKSQHQVENAQVKWVSCLPVVLATRH